jgi:ABC-type Fe3+/spermidine/putrescine transport system ATPase subunit
MVMSEKNILNCRRLAKSYGHAQVLRGVDLTLTRSRAYVLLGQSGSGKTTLARIFCGLESPDSGALDVSNGARLMMLPQDFVIWPHLTVLENIRVGCRGDRRGQAELISRWLGKLRLETLGERKASTLSFGQQQRVALARALCFEPDLLILDEPLAHLDSPMRRALAWEIKQLCSEAEIALLWITHEAAEAFTVADVVAVLADGIILQSGEPEAIYHRPVTKAIAELGGEISWLAPGDWAWLCEQMNCESATVASSTLHLGVRPHSLAILEPSADGCRFQRTQFVGPGYLYQTCLPAGSVLKVYHPERIALDRPHRLRLLEKPCAL